MTTIKKITHTDTATGNPAEEWLDEQGRRHNPDGPAYIERDADTGQIVIEAHFRDGKRHKDQGPAVVHFDDIGGRAREEFWQDGALQSQEGRPSVVEYRYGTITLQEWHDKDQLHRDGDQPAVLGWSEDTGAFVKAEYYRRGEAHRDNGPAMLLTNPDDHIRQELWWRNGRLDRQNGPAALTWNLIAPDDQPGWIVDEASCEEQWARAGVSFAPSAHDRLRWEATKVRQGGTEWREPEVKDELRTKPAAPKQGGVKAAAAKAKEAGPKSGRPRPVSKRMER